MNPSALKRLDRFLWNPAAGVAKAGSCIMGFRQRDPRPLILRPGGMGDLILLCIAAEELGCDLSNFLWAIERRSSAWARHLGLDYFCYDEGMVGQHCWIAGRFSTVINSEQRFGLSQATALLACARDAELTCFETNRAARWAHLRVAYDPDGTHEVTAFRHLLASALRLGHFPAAPVPRRTRSVLASERPVVGLSGLQSESRAFSEDAWTSFIERWSDGRTFWIASSENDRLLARRLEARFDGRAEVFEGSFSELCGLISRSEEVLTVDGGFLHIASYYGIPVTGVFTSGRERKWAALAPGSRVVRRGDLPCQPCTWFGQVPPCGNQFACKQVDFEKHVQPCEAVK